MEALPDAIYRFDDFELDCARRELRRNGRPLPLKSKTLDLLQYLVTNHGKLVTKNELLENVWPGQFVEENNLTVQISALRKLFAAEGFSDPIKTVSGKGYTFVATVLDSVEDIIVERRSISRVTIEETATVQRNDSLRAIKYGLLGSAASVLLLAALGFAFWRTAQKPEQPEYRLASVTSSGDITSATVSRDGRWAVFARKVSGGESLWIRQIETGSEQQIQEVKPLRYTGLTVSPDGGSIFATTFSPERPDPQLFRIPLIGGTPALIPNVTTGAAVSVSPDGSRIAYTESRSARKQTHLISANADGSDERLIGRAEDERRSFPNFNSNPVAWSRDGRWIAVAFAETGERAAQGILLVTPDGSIEKILGEQRWEYLENVAWTSDNRIAFTAYSSNPWSGQIWTIDVSTGIANQITNEFASYSWLSASSKGLLAVKRSSVSRISAGTLDAAAGMIELNQIVSESGAIDNVAFIGDDELLYSSAKGGNQDIWRVGTDGSKPSQLTVGANVGLGLAVSPDQQRLVFAATNEGISALKIAGVSGGSIQNISGGPDDVFPSFSPDGKSIVFQKGINHRRLTAWRLDLDGLRESIIIESAANRPALSPDGTMIAYYFMDQETDGLWRIGFSSTTDGSFRSKLSFPRPVTERQFRWLPDGTAIVQAFYDGPRLGFLMLSISGAGSTEILTGLSGDLQSFAISPAGKRIAASVAEHRDDIVTFSTP